MKKILALTILFVFTLGATALATTNWTTDGHVEYGFDKTGSEETEWFADWRLNVAGNVDERSGFQLRFDPDEYGVATATLYNLWTQTPVGKLVVGRQVENMTMLDIVKDASYMNLSWAALDGVQGVGLYPNVPDNTKLFVFYDGVDKGFGGQGSYTLDRLTVYGGWSQLEDLDAIMALGASYELVADAVTIYGEYDTYSDESEEIVGAKLQVAGFDVVGEYMVEEELWGFKVAKTINAVEWAYHLYQADDTTTEVSAKLKF